MAQARRREQDYVVALLSGRYTTGLDAEGKTVSVWQPSKQNPYPTLSKLMLEKTKNYSEDQVLVFERLRLRPVNLDQSVFAKTTIEKKEFKRLKKEHRASMVKAGFNPNTRLNISEPQRLK
jgi:hypothetical protein